MQIKSCFIGSPQTKISTRLQLLDVPVLFTRRRMQQNECFLFIILKSKHSITSIRDLLTQYSHCQASFPSSANRQGTLVNNMMDYIDNTICNKTIQKLNLKSKESSSQKKITDRFEMCYINCNYQVCRVNKIIGWTLSLWFEHISMPE